MSGRSNNRRRGKEIEGEVLCFCGFPAKITQAWTDKNPGRRFYGCERYKRGGECKFFQWYDEGEAFGWQKEALIQARNEIREKKNTIVELNKIISELRSLLVKKEGEELVKKEGEEEDIINKFLKL